MLATDTVAPFLAAAKESAGPAWIATVTKLVVLGISAPMWIPILKELWKEVNESLAEEGGIFGEAPDENEAKAINLTRTREGKSMVSVLMEDRAKDVKGAKGSKGGRSTRRKSAGSRAPTRRSF
ncbi:MAG: hypothetical protein ACJAZ8_001334 [Planctomycetota bacterium]|jgi:hypothetical protein